jgi:hypothetical protein
MAERADRLLEAVREARARRAARSRTPDEPALRHGLHRARAAWRSSGRTGCALRHRLPLPHPERRAARCELDARDRAGPAGARARACPPGTFRLGFDDAALSVKEHARLAGSSARGSSSSRRAAWSRRCASSRTPGSSSASARAPAPGRRRARGRPARAALAALRSSRSRFDLEMTMRASRAHARRSRRSSPRRRTGRCRHVRSRATSVIEAGNPLRSRRLGAQLDGYASGLHQDVRDLRRRRPARQEVYATVLRAQEASLAAVAPGPLGKEVDAVRPRDHRRRRATRALRATGWARGGMGRPRGGRGSAARARSRSRRGTSSPWSPGSTSPGRSGSASRTSSR